MNWSYSADFPSTAPVLGIDQHAERHEIDSETAEYFFVVIECHTDSFGDVGRENRGDFFGIFLCYDDNAQFGA